MKKTIKTSIVLFLLLLIHTSVNSQVVGDSESKFTLLFRLELKNTPEEMEEHWQKWIGELMAANKFVSMEQFGQNGRVITQKNPIKESIYIDSKKLMVSGYVTIKAKNIDEAVEIARKSPILMMEGTIEVRDIVIY